MERVEPLILVPKAYVSASIDSVGYYGMIEKDIATGL